MEASDEEKAFITGSRAYGTPHEKSDLDLVVRIDASELARIVAAGVADKCREYPENASVSLRFGRLNLICVTSDESLRVWRKGTTRLIEMAPVKREDAIKHFAGLGITPRFDSAADEDELIGAGIDDLPEIEF